MNTIQQKAFTIVVAIAAVVIGSVMNSHPAVAQNPNAGAAPVRITSPLPLPITGTVAATQSGIWNVGIQGSPTVKVRSLDERGRMPFTATILCSTSVFCVAGGGFVIPAGQRLVIEHANGTTSPNAVVTITPNNEATGSPAGAATFLPSTAQTATTYVINADLLTYIEPMLGVRLSVSGGNGTSTSVTLTGYLVDLTI